MADLPDIILERLLDHKELDRISEELKQTALDGSGFLELGRPNQRRHPRTLNGKRLTLNDRNHRRDRRKTDTLPLIGDTCIGNITGLLERQLAHKVPQEGETQDWVRIQLAGEDDSDPDSDKLRAESFSFSQNNAKTAKKSAIGFFARNLVRTLSVRSKVTSLATL
jgi:hypothetical protein